MNVKCTNIIQQVCLPLDRMDRKICRQVILRHVKNGMFCNGFPFVPMGIFLLPNTFSTSAINIVHVEILQILLYDLMSMLSKKCFDHALGGSTIFAQLFA